MVKAKTLLRRKKSSANTLHEKDKRPLKLKKGANVKDSNPTEELLDEDFISRALWECLKNGDPEGVVEVLLIYLEAVNKTHIAQEASIARSTIYALKGGNPTVKTLAKLVHACA